MRDSQQNKLGGFSWKVTVSSENNSTVVFNLSYIPDTERQEDFKHVAMCHQNYYNPYHIAITWNKKITLILS